MTTSYQFMEDKPRSSARGLAHMLELEAHLEDSWREEEFRSILEHQLTVPLLVDLAGGDPQAGAKIQMLERTAGGASMTFGDLLNHPAPPVELLRMAKDWLKAQASHAQPLLPREVATALYHAVITVALVRCGARITQLDEENRRAGLEWTLKQAWVVEPFRGILLQGRME